MPCVLDFHCSNEDCEAHGKPFESMLKSWDSPDPKCPYCEAPLTRHHPAPKPVWLKPYAQYGQPGKEKFNSDAEGIFVHRVKSSRLPDGSPERVRLTSRAEVKEYCRQEGLVMPDDINPNVTVREDGKGMDTRGLKGQWV
jgi:hypothetical protein